MNYPTFAAFQTAASRTFRPEDQAPKTLTGQETNLLLGAMGLASETGEFLDHVKKILFHEQKLEGDRLTKMLAELGDILWYHSCACKALRVTMDEVAEGNVKKLLLRHPNGVDFSYHDQGDSHGEVDREQEAVLVALQGKVYRNEQLGGYTFVHNNKHLVLQFSDQELTGVLPRWTLGRNFRNPPPEQVESLVKQFAISKIKEALSVPEVVGE